MTDAPPLDGLSDAFGRAPCGLLVFTDDGRIVCANATLTGLLGAESLVGTSVETLMPLAARIFYQTHLVPMLRLHGRLDEVDLTLTTTSGDSVPVLINAVRHDARCPDEAGGSQARTHCAVFPVARRRQFEMELLEARRRAERALAETNAVTVRLRETLDQLRAAQNQLVHEEKLAGLGRMATAVAHEVRNPLTFIIGFTGLSAELLADLRAHLDDGEPGGRSETLAVLAALEENVSRTVRHSHRVDTIVSRMTAHVAATNMRPVAVNAVAEMAVAAVATRRPADIALDLAANAGEIDGDPDALALALAALLDNALDALDDRATWDNAFEASVMLRTRLAGEGSVVAEVIDTGGGIAETDRARVLEPFFTTRGPTSGHSGLGLSRAYETVRRHNGELSVGGEAGVGATVSVTLRSRVA